MKRRKRAGRKLLVASVGVAAISYACGGDSDSDSGAKDSGTGGTYSMDAVANLVAPDAGGEDANVLDVVANLVAPDASEQDSGAEDAPSDQISTPLDVVANLVAPDSGSN